MKNVCIILALMLGLTTIAYSQEGKEGQHGHRHLPSGHSFGIGIHAGVAMPLGDITEEYAFAGPGLDVNANLDYNFRKWGIRAQAGYFEFNTEENFEDFLGDKAYNLAANPWEATYYTLGPKLKWGRHHVEIEAAIFGGLMNLNVPEIVQSDVLPVSAGTYVNFQQNGQALKNQILAGASIGATYKINDWLGIKASASYMSNRFAGNTTYTNSIKVPTDFNDDGVVDDGELIESSFVVQERSTVMSSVSFRMGLAANIPWGDDIEVDTMGQHFGGHDDDDIIIDNGGFSNGISLGMRSSSNTEVRSSARASDTGLYVQYACSGLLRRNGVSPKDMMLEVRLLKNGRLEPNADIQIIVNGQSISEDFNFVASSSDIPFHIVLKLDKRYYRSGDDLELICNLNKHGGARHLTIDNMLTIQQLDANSTPAGHGHLRRINLTVNPWRKDMKSQKKQLRYN